MAKPNHRADVVAMMRANIGMIRRDVTGYLSRECEDMLAAGIEQHALGFSLMQLALFHNTQIVGAAEMIDQLRNVADVLEKNLAAKCTPFDGEVRH